MALVKTDYGLVYNDDGSFCATIRKDDVPFEGAVSFALETTTTNMFNNPIFADGESGYDQIFGWNSRTIKDGGPFGRYIELVDSSSSTGCSYGKYFNVTPNVTYTFSAYINVLQWNNQGSIDLYYHWLDSNNSLIRAEISVTLGEERPQDFLGKGWRRYKITATAPSNAAKVKAYIYSSITATSRIQAAGFQFEQLSFATSFVIGSRSKSGKFYIPLNKLGFDPAVSDWVIAYWKKPTSTHTNNLNGLNCFSIGQYTTDSSKGYIAWGKKNNENKFQISAVLSDSTYLTIDASTTFTQSWYFNNWHFEVMKKQGSTISYYVDGNLVASGTLSTSLKAFTEGLYVGGYADGTNYYPVNSLISNLLISTNPSIWTNNFIKQVYNTRKPFAVPPRMPVV